MIKSKNMKRGPPGSAFFHALITKAYPNRKKGKQDEDKSKKDRGACACCCPLR